MSPAASPPFHWIFHTALPEQTGEFLQLASRLGQEYEARMLAAATVDGVAVRAEFAGAAEAAEERGRAFWLALHEGCLDRNLALELMAEFDPPVGWVSLEHFPCGPMAVAAPRPDTAPPPAAGAVSHLRPEIPAAPVYDLFRADDPELDRNLDGTIAWIESQGLPVINLLSYLDLPLFQEYAAAHGEERDQNLFLHMLHTWACYRHFGAVHARLSPALMAAFANPIYLRLNTTQFRSPAPAFCLQFPDWEQPVRGPRPQWVKEVYFTHLEPPTPADDRELTLMVVAHDQRGEFGFIPLEVPLSLPGVGQSLDAFFAPGEGDEELGANTGDLHRVTAITATYCLYATAADPQRYLGGGPVPSGG